MSASKRAAFVGIFLLLFHMGSEMALAKKKDFKGLFGSFRREKFTENEGNDSDWGFDLMLSTFYPMSTFVSSADAGAMPKTISFNFELNLYKTFGYHTLVYLGTGRMSYDTRQSVSAGTSANIAADDANLAKITQFSLFDMSAVPVLLGVKYRFSRTDFVPYLGVAGGVSFVTRHASYNFSNLSHSDSQMAPTFQAYGGFEFFFAPGAGLRVELGAHAALVKQRFNDTLVVTVPSITFPATNIALRYASGVFILF